MPNTIPLNFPERLSGGCVKAVSKQFTGRYYIYGYKIVVKKWTLDEPQAAIVRKISNYYTQNVRQKDIIANSMKKELLHSTANRLIQ